MRDASSDGNMAPTELIVERNSGQVTLRSAALGMNQPWNVTGALVGRLLAANIVQSVTLDRSKQSASFRFINHNPMEVNAAGPPADQLKELAAHLRQPGTAAAAISDQYAEIDRLQLSKTDAGMTAGVIVHSIPGRLRIRHPLVRDNSNLDKMKQDLTSTAGVKSISISSMTGSVLLIFDHAITRSTDLVEALERSITARQDQVKLLNGPSASRWIASGACLGFAVASELFVPGLSIVTAMALLGFNVSAMARGVVELVTLNWKMAALYTVIMGTTLLSGQFLAAAVMQASITCWHGWSSHRLRRIAKQLQFQSDLPIRLAPSHRMLLVNGERFPECLLGTEIVIEPDSVIPYDGVVTSGSGVLDERSVRGKSGHVQRQLGDVVFAGSILVSGSIRIRITAVEKETRLSRIRETLLSSISELPGSGTPTNRGHASASRFVPFTFASGTAALMVGDISTLAAVLRPDFATGPSISERFGTLTSIGHLWDRGWLVRNSDSLHELALTKIVVILRQVVTRATKTASEATRTARRTESCCQSSTDESHIHSRRATIGTQSLDIHEVECSAEHCVEFVRQLRTEQRHIAVVADENVLSLLQSEDIVRISTTPEKSLSQPSADVIELHSDARQIEDLWKVLSDARRPQHHGWAAVVTCNALAISGAFLVGLTSLHVVFLTNLGALAAGLFYNRHFKRSSMMLSSASSMVRTSGHDSRSNAGDRTSSSTNFDVTIATVKERTVMRPTAIATQPTAARSNQRKLADCHPRHVKQRTDRESRTDYESNDWARQS